VSAVIVAPEPTGPANTRLPPTAAGPAAAKPAMTTGEASAAGTA
jgi:hypothetical protein